MLYGDFKLQVYRVWAPAGAGSTPGPDTVGGVTWGGRGLHPGHFCSLYGGSRGGAGIVGAIMLRNYNSLT